MTRNAPTGTSKARRVLSRSSIIRLATTDRRPEHRRPRRRA
jgi:hypothetical protein